MGATINDNKGYKLNGNLQNDTSEFNEFVVLLKEKIEECIMEDRQIIVNGSNVIMGYRNIFFVEDYEVDDELLYLNNENFELHIDLKEAAIKYNDSFTNIIFTYGNMEVELYFE